MGGKYSLFLIFLSVESMQYSSDYHYLDSITEKWVSTTACYLPAAQLNLLGIASQVDFQLNTHQFFIGQSNMKCREGEINDGI